MESIFGGYVILNFLKLKSDFLTGFFFLKFRLSFWISVGLIKNTLLSWWNFLENFVVFPRGWDIFSAYEFWSRYTSAGIRPGVFTAINFSFLLENLQKGLFTRALLNFFFFSHGKNFRIFKRKVLITFDKKPVESFNEHFLNKRI